MHVDGDLSLRECKSLASLPEGLHVGGDLDLSFCESLTSLPEGLHVGGNLDLGYCESLTSLPAGFHVGGDLSLEGCTNLTSLSSNLRIGRNLDIRRCTGITSIPEDLYVRNKLSISPDDFKRLWLSGKFSDKLFSENTSSCYISITGDLSFENCSRITDLPPRLEVSGSLNLKGCTNLHKVDRKLSVGGKLILSPDDFKRLWLSGDFPDKPVYIHDDLLFTSNDNLRSLPNGLNVEGILELRDCTRIHLLPEVLKFKHLGIEGCSRITSIPERVLSVGAASDVEHRMIFIGGSGISNETFVHLQRRHLGRIFFRFDRVSPPPEPVNHIEKLLTLQINNVQNFTARDVQKAFLRLSVTHHPDKGGDPDMFIKIVDAKDALIKYLEDRR